MEKVALVIPTNRRQSLDLFFDAWYNKDHLQTTDHRGFADWDRSLLVIVEDNPKKTFSFGPPVTHVSWEEIDAELGDDAWIFSRRDSAIRSYGFFKACQLGARFVVTLDDDCLPLNHGFCQKHIDNLTKSTRWCESIPGVRTRGLPYKDLGVCNNVAFSVGLWQENPDYDAVQTLSGTGPKNPTLPATRVMPSGQFWPFCGMNFAFPASSLPMCYFPPMGKDQPFSRFDDIWFGIVAQKVCEHLNLSITCGEPYIRHCRASNPFVNLEREAPGIRQNEVFWRMIDSFEMCGWDVADCMKAIASQLVTLDDESAECQGVDKPFRQYLNNYGKALEVWLRLVSSFHPKE